MIVQDTTSGIQKPVHMRELEYLVSNTTGIAMESPVLEGVLTATNQGIPYAQAGATTPLMMSHERFATAPQMAVYGQVPFADGKGQVKGHSAPAMKEKKSGTKKGEERKTARKAYEKKK
jgi:hypothetical protein